MDERIAGLAREASDAEERLRRLYKLVEDGVTEADELLKVRIVAIKGDRDRAQAALKRAMAALQSTVAISSTAMHQFGEIMREKLTSGDVPFRKAYLGAIVDRIEVDGHNVRIVGRKDVLEQAVMTSGGPVPGVRSFVRNWRTGKDSNTRPPDP